MKKIKRIKVSSKKKKYEKPRFWVITGMVTFFLLLFTVVFMISVFKHITVEQKSTLGRRVVRVQVLNGCGKKGIGEKIGDYIRSLDINNWAFDVVEVKNAPVFGFSHTLVVARRKDDVSAKAIAESLNLGESNVLLERLPHNPLEIDVTVVIGDDLKEKIT